MVTGGVPGSILITEIFADPATTPEVAREWVELFNRTDQGIWIAGWTIVDNQGSDSLPVRWLGPGQFLVIRASADEAGGGQDVVLGDGRIGNGLANQGDWVVLRDAFGQVIDEVSYGQDTTVTDPPCPAAASGRSLERIWPQSRARPAPSSSRTCRRRALRPGHALHQRRHPRLRSPNPLPRPSTKS